MHMGRGRPLTTPTAAVPPGWYADPWQRAALRHWSGHTWEPWVSDGRTVRADEAPARRPLQPQDVDALRVVGEVFLPEAHARGLLAPGQSPQLLHLVSLLAEEARRLSVPWATTIRPAPEGFPALPGVQGRAPAAGLPGDAQPRDVLAPLHPRTALPRSAPAGAPREDPAPWMDGVLSRQATTATPRPPSALSQWAARARLAVGSDLAVHGLAYLGVLLLFTGLFGLVAFAFADVTPGLRPLAELAGAVVPFIAARVLLRHGAGVVGRSLEVVGGLLVAVMVVTSLLDDVPFPPDPTGGALRAALTVVCLLTAGGYALWSRGHRESGLRFLVGPMLWFAAAMASMGVGRPIPDGEAVAVPSSAQLSAMAATLVLTVLAARRWPGSHLARPATTAAIPGVVVLAVLTTLTWAAEGWPAGPVAVTGVMLLVAFLLLAPRLPASLVHVGAPLWWTLVSLALLPSLAAPAAGAVAVAGFLLLLELAHARGGTDAALALPGAGLLVSALLVSTDPEWSVLTWSALLAWVVLRRTRPYAPSRRPRREGAPEGLPPATVGHPVGVVVPGVVASGWAAVLDVASAALPVALTLAVGQATTFAAGLAVGSCLVAAATVPALGRGLGRGPVDRFWRLWWWAALPVTTAVAVTEWTSVGTTGEEWLMVSSLGVLTVSAILGPLPPVWRPWAVASLGTVGWVMAASAGTFPDAVRALVPALAALAMVVVAHRRRVPEVADPALGLAGHVLALVAVGLTGTGWGRVAVVALATTGLLWSARYDDQGRSPVGAAITRLSPVTRPLLWALSLAGIPWTVWLALEQGRTPVTSTHPWVGTGLLAAAGLLYAVAAHLRGASVRVATLAWVGFVGTLLGLVLADRPWSVIAGLAAVITCVLVLPAALRAAPMRWAAWLAVAPLVGLLARQVVPWVAELPVATAAAGTLVVVGGVLAVGVVARDTLSPIVARAAIPEAPETAHGGLGATQARWVPRVTLRRPGLTAILAVACADLLVGLALAPAAPVVHGAVLLILVGAVVLAVGVLARAGLLGGIAVVLTWFGAWALARDAAQVGPWLGVLVTAGLLILAEALHRLPDRLWWSRWDIPVLVAAAPVAATALAGALAGGPYVTTFVAVGLMAVAVAVRLHRRPVAAEVLGWAGTVLVLTGASGQGAGWLALALVVLAAAHTGLAVRAHGGVRTIRQVIGVVAALAAWFAALSWFAWSTQQSVDVTAVVGGAVALLAAGAARLHVDRSWTAVWGGAAALVVAGATVASFLSDGGASLDVAPSLWVAVALAGTSGAMLASAAPLTMPVLRHLGVVPLLATVLVALRASEAMVGTQVDVLTALAVGLAVVTLLAATRRPRGVWVVPSAELGGAAAVIAVLLATLPVADLALLAPALAAAAVQAAAGGVVLRSLGLQVLAICLACGAWLAFVAHTLEGGSPSWYTVAIGLALLAIVGLWRRDRRTRAEDVASPEVVSVEMVAVSFLVGAPFVQAVTDSVLYALVAVGIGLAVVGWGAATRVRRRVAAGAVVVLAALVVLVAVPLVALLPAWGGAGLWLLIAGVGLVAVLVATFVERGRTVARSTIARVGEATADWE